MITPAVAAEASRLGDTDQLPAFVYDMTALRDHVAAVRNALPTSTEIFYAAKANPDAPILRTVAPFVDGIEVASGGELEHVRKVLPKARLNFGGPGKTDSELRLALALGVERIHVESPYELTRLAAIAQQAGQSIDIMLRVNLATTRAGAALAMSGPFGMDPELIQSCRTILAASPELRLRGIHAHLASGLNAAAMLQQSAAILAWARPWLADSGVSNPEINLGGGMAVDYIDPTDVFDWAAYGKGLAALARPSETLRIEPGRAITAYAGAYVTQVLDVKRAHGEWFAVLRGGTMQLRTPVTKGHNQPHVIISRGRSTGPFVHGAAVTLVGQLCTPKDVFARSVEIDHIAVGDVVAFAMAGAYGWNISHHDFLMHPKPAFVYLGLDQIGHAGV
ncbi:type III PLP-dependent enzyme [Kitasatospora sp. NPDC058406]|uniref:type III PLP-dependent enzyme n=1 Tax=Kitasatospora sp. NPDC058406 TaxID=3346483 RepID=UPI00364A0A5F